MALEQVVAEQVHGHARGGRGVGQARDVVLGGGVDGEVRAAFFGKPQGQGHGVLGGARLVVRDAGPEGDLDDPVGLAPARGKRGEGGFLDHGVVQHAGVGHGADFVLV